MVEDKSNEKDVRVKKLLTMKSRDERINQLYTWVLKGQLTGQDFNSLFKIVAREAEVTEIFKELDNLVKKYGVGSENASAEMAALSKLRGSLTLLRRKSEVAAGLKETD